MTEKDTLYHKNCFYRISIKALILDEEKRFLLSFENKGLWDFPGGGLDFGEKAEECLTREIKEEVGLELTHINKKPAYFLTALNRTGEFWVCNVLYEVKVKNLDFTPSDECVKLQFFTKEEALKENLFSNVVEFIKIYNPDNH